MLFLRSTQLVEVHTLKGATDATAVNQLLGASAAIGTAALALATGGLCVFPARVFMAGASGAAIGSGINQKRGASTRKYRLNA